MPLSQENLSHNCYTVDRAQVQKKRDAVRKEMTREGVELKRLGENEARHNTIATTTMMLVIFFALFLVVVC